jgi:hypothetical protein
MKSRLLLLIQTHAHAAALMGCIPHIQAHYDWIWIVYSPAVLADPATVEMEYDARIADLTRAARECYSREDGAGGDAYKAQRDAAILEKSAKVKDAWKALATEQQTAAVNRLFKPFFDIIKSDPTMKAGIYQCQDHFETTAHVEMQNSLKAAPAAKNFLAGEYMIGWPTSLPKSGEIQQKPEEIPAKTPVPVAAPAPAPTAATPTATTKKRGRPPIDPRLRELMQMSLDDLGPIAFELGIKPTDPIAGKRMALVHRVHELEKERADKEIAQM